jgi:UDPglucose 6-dehydrogenase
VIIPALQAEGAVIQAYDPEGMTAADAELPGVVWCQDAYGAMDNADAVVILTEWNVFRALDLEQAKRLLRRPIMVDLRNVYEPRDMIAAGFSYSSIGRPVANTAYAMEHAEA